MNKKKGLLAAAACGFMLIVLSATRRDQPTMGPDPIICILNEFGSELQLVMANLLPWAADHQESFLTAADFAPSPKEADFEWPKELLPGKKQNCPIRRISD